MRILTICLFVLAPFGAAAQSAADLVAIAVNDHVLPRYARLVTEAETLAEVAQDSCAPGDAALEAAFHNAFDAWIGVSHFTFGPAEVDGRYYNLAFWPDSRGLTGRSLGRLISEQDPIVEDPAAFTEESVAARGFFALEFLLFDPQIAVAGDPDYHCALVQAVATDIAATANLIRDDWVNSFADLMLTARGERQIPVS